MENESAQFWDNTTHEDISAPQNKCAALKLVALKYTNEILAVVSTLKPMSNPVSVQSEKQLWHFIFSLHQSWKIQSDWHQSYEALHGKTNLTDVQNRSHGVNAPYV